MNKLFREDKPHTAYMRELLLEDGIDLYASRSGEKQVHLGKVHKDKFDRVKRIIKTESSNVSELVDIIYERAGWNNDVAKASMINAFQDNNTDYEKINSWIDIVSKGTKEFDSLVSKDGVGNLLDGSLFSRKLEEIFASHNDYLGWIQHLHHTTFQENSLGVGKGELLLTCALSCTKGQSGDIMYNGLELEIKGKGARPGGQGYVYNNGRREVSKIVSEIFADNIMNLLSIMLLRLLCLIQALTIKGYKSMRAVAKMQRLKEKLYIV